MRRTARGMLYLFFMTAAFATVEGQASYQEVIDNSKGLKVPSIAKNMIGNKIFEFDLNTLEGRKVNNDSIMGKVTVLNFWFIGCPPCIAEMKGLNEIVDKYEKEEDVRFLAIALDNKESLDSTFFPNHEFKFEIIPDAVDFIFTQIQYPFGYPATFVVDKAGIIRKISVGSSRIEAEATTKIKEVLIPAIDECLDK